MDDVLRDGRQRFATPVHIVNGPHTGSTGSLGFIDAEGGYGLVDCGEGRLGGLTWIPLDCIRDAGGRALNWPLTRARVVREIVEWLRGFVMNRNAQVFADEIARRFGATMPEHKPRTAVVRPPADPTLEEMAREWLASRGLEDHTDGRCACESTGLALLRSVEARTLRRAAEECQLYARERRQAAIDRSAKNITIDDARMWGGFDCATRILALGGDRKEDGDG